MTMNVLFLLFFFCYDNVNVMDKHANGNSIETVNRDINKYYDWRLVIIDSIVTNSMNSNLVAQNFGFKKEVDFGSEDMLSFKYLIKYESSFSTTEQA